MYIRVQYHLYTGEQFHVYTGTISFIYGYNFIYIRVQFHLYTDTISFIYRYITVIAVGLKQTIPNLTQDKRQTYLSLDQGFKIIMLIISLSE
jgi:hypothetical protein